MIALFAGTFDPPSLGHLDIIRKSSSLFDQLIVGVALNLKKKPKELFALEEKVELLEKITRDLPNVKIESYSSLTTDFAKSKGAKVLIRGIRAFTDTNAEFQMALANRKLANLETLFLLGDEKLSHISSTLIREIAHAKGPLQDFVPPEIESLVRSKINQVKFS